MAEKRACSDSGMAEIGKGDDKRAVSTLRWKGRTHINFIAGLSRLRVLPVVIHLLPDDIEWFSEDPTLFKELQMLLQDRVISVTNDGEKDPEAPKSRKRARKEESCIQGRRLQFTYRYRKTLPRYTVLSYEEYHNGIESLGEGNNVNTTASSTRSSGNKGPNFRHFPLSDSTLLVWVYRFNPEDPYAAVPNEAALQFAPSKQQSSGKAFDPEAIGRDVGRAERIGGIRAGPRDTGLLAWLWGSKNGDKGNAGRSAGGVRQHFIGSAAWEGTPTTQRGQEDEDIQRAIALSLAMISGGGSGQGDKGTGRDAVEVHDDA